MKRLALLALLLAAPLAAQDAVTSITYETVPMDSLLALAERGDTIAASFLFTHRVELIADVRADGAAAVCCQGGVPGWFYGGVLVIGIGAVLAYIYTESEQTTINVNQSQSQEQTTTVTTRRRVKWKKKRWPHPGEEEEEDGGLDP